jgi:glutaminyl-peptide cyclotransferase
VRYPLIFLTFIILFFSGCKKDPQPEKNVDEISFTLTGTYPHDTLSYTEGLLFYNDSLFESTGSPEAFPAARSVFGTIDPVTGRINIKAELDKNIYFGEGIAYLQGNFYQLTYRNQLGFIYDAATYEPLGRFSFLSEEGWGLTADGQSLIMSDGTDKLTFIDPQTFLIRKILHATENGTPKQNLNELEFIRGSIYANIWHSDQIIRIDTADGRITGIIDLEDLVKDASGIYPRSREMNGIAYDSISNRIYITGKFWPKIYKIETVE